MREQSRREYESYRGARKLQKKIAIEVFKEVVNRETEAISSLKRQGISRIKEQRIVGNRNFTRRTFNNICVTWSGLKVCTCFPEMLPKP